MVFVPRSVVDSGQVFMFCRDDLIPLLVRGRQLFGTAVCSLEENSINYLEIENLLSIECPKGTLVNLISLFSLGEIQSSLW